MNFLMKLIIFIGLTIIILPPIHELGHVLICRNHGWKVLKVNWFEWVQYDPTIEGRYLIGEAERIHNKYDEIFPLYYTLIVGVLTLFLIIEDNLRNHRREIPSVA